MRVLLRIFVLATAAVAWVASAHDPAAARSGQSRAARDVWAMPGLIAAASDPASGSAPSPASPVGLTDGSTEAAPEAPAAGIVCGMTVSAPDESEADSIPVDVLLVDGENGEVLQRMETSLRRGQDGVLTFAVTAPGGYVADPAGTREVRAYVSRHADRARVLEPLRREADIRVHVVGPAGQPVRGAKLVEVFRGGSGPLITALGAEPPEPTGEPDVPDEIDTSGGGASVLSARAAPTGADGWMRVRGIPHLLDERYWIVVREGKREAFGYVVLGAFGERSSLEIHLPVASTRPNATCSAIGVCGGWGCVVRGRGSRRTRLVPATLEVFVRCRDGRMGSGLDVYLASRKATTDASGRVLFEGLLPGTYPVEVRDPEFVWSKADVKLEAGERSAFVFQESNGWTPHVTLLDSTGRRVPFARVSVASAAPVPYVHVEDGVQDLVFLTDENGELVLPRMHGAPVELTFRYGSRSADVTLGEGSADATVQLPAPNRD